MKTKNKITAIILTVVITFVALCTPSFAIFENSHNNRGYQADDLIAVAKTQIGYKEGSLDGKEQGYNDYTKYGLWYAKSFAYQPWCAMFISWCADQARIPTSIIPKFASCDAGMMWFYNHGNFAFSKNYGGWMPPQVGDIVFFGYQLSDGTFDSTHVGIVYAVDDEKIYSLEGNSSYKVQQVAYNKVGSNYGTYIIGYGRPDYDGYSTLPYTADTRCVSQSSTELRSYPSYSYGSALCDIPYGTMLTVTEYSSVWGKTTYGGVEGWVKLEECDVKFDSLAIHFDSNGGWGEPDSIVKCQQKDVILPSTEPQRYGYSFEGWSIYPDADYATYYPEMPFTANQNVTLYAVWQPLTPDITYNVGKGGIAERIVKGDNITFRILAKPGYVYSCMTLDGEYDGLSGNQSYRYFTVDATSPHHLEFAFEPTTLDGVNPYCDILSSEWYYDAAVTCYYTNLMYGTSDAEFSPDVYLTRAQLVTVIANMFLHDGGAIWDSDEPPFTDIDKNSYYYKYLCWAYDFGIAAGTTDTTFEPNKAVTREEFAVMIYNYNNAVTRYPNELFTPIAAVYHDYYDTSSWARVSMLWAINNSLISGSGCYLSPKCTLTRSQCAQVLSGYYR